MRITNFAENYSRKVKLPHWRKSLRKSNLQQRSGRKTTIERPSQFRHFRPQIVADKNAKVKDNT